MLSNIRTAIATPLALLITIVFSIIGIGLDLLRVEHGAQNLRMVWGKIVIRLYGIKLDVSGELTESTNTIFLVRHISLIDTFIYPAILPVNTIYIAKIELSKFPLVSQFYKAAGGIFVDRKNQIKAIKAIKKDSAQYFPGNNLFIHPEGTRCPETEPGELKAGFLTLRKELPSVVPISSFGGEAMHTKGSFVVKSGTIKVAIGPSIKISDYPDKQVLIDTLNQIYQDHIQSNL